jgi:hypothetical protein
MRKGKARFLRTQEPPKLSHLVMIRNVLVTPTRILIGPPQQEPSNSVTRRYADKLDGIARVTFTDEEDRLFVCCENDEQARADTLGQRLQQGIRLSATRCWYHGASQTGPAARSCHWRGYILPGCILSFAAKVGSHPSPGSVTLTLEGSIDLVHQPEGD